MKLNWERKGQEVPKQVKSWEKLTEVNSCYKPRVTDGKLVGEKMSTGLKKVHTLLEIQGKIQTYCRFEGRAASAPILTSSHPLIDEISDTNF